MEQIAAKEQKVIPFETLVEATNNFHQNHKLGDIYCCTIDNHTLEKNIVSIRDRDSLNQEFIPLEHLKDYLV
ncbi:MAG: His/Gly/Thr/Pro-type tRNA ligase C-terminal domain-containing protein, partial [Sweet potato little leaf phytoplasma]|nr:His/Gly/Thr/Pro-type tRNA ligase C-terminal domain-containing protein [Sweet potato little leaf phytoplasma]